jgi:hypothetical protein
MTTIVKGKEMELVFFFETKGMELLVKYTSVQIRLLASTEFCRDVLHGQREILTVANAMTENIKVNGRHQSCCWYTEISCHRDKHKKNNKKDCQNENL